MGHAKNTFDFFKDKLRQRALVNISAKKTSFDKRENDF